ncbi:MAG: peptidoglycan-associated lipoprotein Pal, partial [Candidatus Rokuibacteriota bacterium]
AAPAATPPPPAEFAASDNLRDVFYAFDKAEIRPGDAKTLDAGAAYLKANPRLLVLVEGHCDERGTEEYNIALGERRAASALNYLVAQGIEAGRFTRISYGESRPSCAEHRESCWVKNRRARFMVKPQ